MKINDITSVGKVASKSKAKSQNYDGVFDSLISEDTSDIPEVETPSFNPISSMGALIAAQTIDNSPAKQQIKHADDVLDSLDHLRMELLEGRISPQSVQNIITQTKQNYGDISDPKLQTIISEIELRAEVELAKLERD